MTRKTFRQQEWSSIHETNVINETGLNPDWKQAEEVSEPKLLMPVMNAEFIVEINTLFD